MKRYIKLLGAGLLAVASAGSLQAGNQLFKFDVNPSSDPALAGSIIVGTHNYFNSAGNQQLWCSGAGTAVNGVPNADSSPSGYLALCDATNNSNNLVFVFPDVDGGLPVAGFQIDLDMRAGSPNASNFRPADGFSISFARAGDIALVNATNNVAAGFAGGDGSVANASIPTGSTDLENGTKTGVAVVFDAWHGNYLPDTTAFSAGTGDFATDREGIAIRLDDKTLVQLDLLANRNAADCAQNGVSAWQTNIGRLSEQTGTNVVFFTNTWLTTCPAAPVFGTPNYGTTTSSGTFTNLFWEHLTVRLTNISTTAVATNNLSVSWKGVSVLNTNLDAFAPTVGRLVLAGRTGGNNQNCHIDNIQVNTTVSTNVYLKDIVGGVAGFTFHLEDNGPVTLTSIAQVLLDGANVTGTTTAPVNHPETTGTYLQGTRFAPLSRHVVQVSWVDTSGNTIIGAGAFTVPNFVFFPTNFALPISAVDTTKSGFLINTYQSRWGNPGQLWWTEEQLQGLHGVNVIGTSSFSQTPSPVGTVNIYTGPLGFYNSGDPNPANVSAGEFTGSGDADWLSLGVGANYPSSVGRYDPYDNTAMEFFSYVYFPTSGVYRMVVGSDDSYQISVSQSPYDRMGLVLAQNIGSRVPAPGTQIDGFDIAQVIIDQPGAYPVRILYQNGGGGSAFEWYTYQPPLSSPGFGAFLVNDVANYGSGNGPVVLAYYGLNSGVGTGPFVKAANPARNASDIVFYQPIVFDLNDGSTSPLSISDSSINLTVDGVATPVTKTRSGTAVHCVQTALPNWASGGHTNLVTFADNNGTNYTYTWVFTVIGGANSIAAADATNTTVTIALPASIAKGVGAVDATKPGFRVRSWQTPMEAGQGHSGWADGELQGQKGFNCADQSSATSGYFVFNNAVDFRYASAPANAQAEMTYDVDDFSLFGIGTIVTPIPPTTYAPAYRFNTTPSNTKAETAVIEFAAWLVFPQAGEYLMYVNSDDGFRLMWPQGTLNGRVGPLNTLSNTVFSVDAGRGVAAPAGFVQTGGSYIRIRIPVAGSYPFRLVYFNGGTDGGIEWSIFKSMPDGSVAKVAINDPNYPSAIKAYQALSTGDTWAPYVSHLDPVFNEPDVVLWEPIQIDLNDGPSGMTVNTSTIQLYSDGQLQNITKTTAAGVTHILQQMAPGQVWANGGHTNMLIYSDNLGASYTNMWPFTAVGPNFNIVQVPASLAVPLSQIDLTQPGFRVKPYQTTQGQVAGSLLAFFEAQQLGEWGANLITTIPGSGFLTWTNPVDFEDNNGINASAGEWRFNYSFSNSFGAVINGGAPNENNISLVWGGYMVFPKAGLYAFTVNSDDGFKITVPLGGDVFSPNGLVLDFNDTGRGDTTGGAANPFRGSVTPGVFNIPAAGAYPIRLLWFNGGGGLRLEWSIWEYTADGSVEREIVGNWVNPDMVKVYQTMNTNPCTVQALLTGASGASPGGLTNGITPVLGTQAQIILGNNNAQNGPVTTDVYVGLKGGTVAIDPTSVSLSLNGYVQPIVTTNGNGIVGVYRFATNSILWPSGQYGPLLVNFKDVNGNNYSYTVGYIQTPWLGNTLRGGFPEAAADPTKPGFKVRAAQADPAVDESGVNRGAVTTTGLLALPTRVHLAEQILAGYWGPNQAYLGATNYITGTVTNFYAGFIDGGYFDLAGTGPSNGVVNINAAWPAQGGDFQQNTAGDPFNSDMPMPGFSGRGPTTVSSSQDNNNALEILSYIDFPTNGTYTLGISSDDGFRVTEDWTPPATSGGLLINSPAILAGYHGATLNQSEQPVNSTPITAPISGNLVLAQGTWGASTNGEGCWISNPGALNGNIAIMYRSAFCSVQQQVAGAALANAKACIIIQKRRPVTDGIFPQEDTVNPPQGIPEISIEESLGDRIVSNLNAAVTINATLTVPENQINPAPNHKILGQASFGKGNSDINFQVVVTNAPGIYPVRVVYFNGTGGVNVEFYSLTGNSAVNGGRILINDRSTTNGMALNAYFSLVQPKVTIGGGNITINYNAAGGAQLQSTTSLVAPVTWTPVVGSDPLVIPISSSVPQKFYRSVYTQRP